MRGDYITGVEASEVISRWAQRETSVIFVTELGDFCVSTQRRGTVKLVRPGLAAHIAESGGDCTVVFASRFREIAHLVDDACEVLMLRGPIGATGFEVALVADFDEALQADDVLLLTQAARSVRPPVGD